MGLVYPLVCGLVAEGQSVSQRGECIHSEHQDLAAGRSSERKKMRLSL